MTPEQAAALWLQIYMLLHEQQRLEQRVTVYEQRIEALERRLRKLEMVANKLPIEFSLN